MVVRLRRVSRLINTHEDNERRVPPHHGVATIRRRARTTPRASVSFSISPPPPPPPAFVPWFRSEAVHSTRNSRDAEKRRRVGLNAAGSFDGTWNRGFRSLQKRWTSVWVHCARCSRWANSWNALRMYRACYSNGSGISRLSFRWERFAKLATIQRGYCDLM